MNLTKKRWLILAFGCCINLCIGSLYAWSVLATPMEALLNADYGCMLSEGSLAIVFTVANSIGPVTMISGGKINDTVGPRWVLLIGALLFGGGMFFSGFARNVAMLLASYGLGCGLGMGMIYGCTVSNSVKFFPDKKGLVGGIATASYGISSVLVPPIARILIQSCGILATFRIFGAISFAVIAAGSFVIIQCPADFRPAGWVEPRKVQTAERKEYSWKEMLRTPRFYFMMLIMMCGAISGMMCISQASGIAQKLVGLSASAATGAVSILALFNTGGRIAAGKISDKLGRTKTLGIGLALSLIGLLTLYCTGTSEVLKFYAGISFIGISFGTIMGIYPAFTAEQFGMKNNSVNYGIMFIGFAFAGYIGPMVMKKMYTVQGIYNNAFLFAAGLTACGAVLLFVLKKIDPKFD